MRAHGKPLRPGQVILTGARILATPVPRPAQLRAQVHRSACIPWPGRAMSGSTCTISLRTIAAPAPRFAANFTMLFTEQPLFEHFERATVRPGSAALPASPAVKKNFARAWKRP
jgi:hypothetical protein